MALTLLVGCQRDTVPEAQEEEGKKEQLKLYYINGDKTELVDEPCDYDTTRYRKNNIYKTNIYNLLQLLREDPDIVGAMRSIPSNIVRNRVDYNAENESVVVDYTSTFYDLTPSDALLMRASIILTLTQLEGVSVVKITVNGEPLLDLNGQSIGYLNEKDIITGRDDYLVNAASYTIHLYFATADGSALVLEKRNVELELGQSLPQVLLSEWMKGPETEGLLKINEGNIQVNDVIERNGIAYVDFSKDFLKHQFTSRFTPEIVVYSIVNSLTDLTSVNQVQFLIDGETVEKYRTLEDFDKPFSRNLDIIE